jgi:hypothetical protein
MRLEFAHETGRVNGMTFLPIVERELRVAARRPGTYYVRLLIGLAALATALFLYAATLGMTPVMVGPKIFMGLSILGFVFCLFAGRRWTADCLSEEKREGTLGLLFLTDLKGHDVVLGKLVSSSIGAFYGLLAILPVLALPLLMGGVSNGEFWRMVLVLVNTFLFSLAVGMFASVLNKDAKNAFGVNLLFFLVLAGLPAAGCLAIAAGTPNNLYLPWMCYSCPGFGLAMSFDRMYVVAANREHFWLTMLVVFALTFLLVWLSGRIAPGAWQDRAVETRKMTWRQRLMARWRAWWQGSETWRRAHRARTLDVNAYFWLASRCWGRLRLVWVVLALAAAWWVYLAFVSGIHWYEPEFAILTGVLLNGLFKIWVAVEVAQRLAEDRKEGALELLLSTAMTESDMIRGQWLALRLQFQKPLLLTLTFQLVYMVLASMYSYQSRGGIWPFAVCAAVMLPLDLWALFGVGIHSALTTKNPNQASGATLWRVLVVPSIFCVAFFVLIQVGFSMVGGREPEGGTFLALWVVAGLLADGVFGGHAWAQIRGNFRELALKRAGRGGKTAEGGKN